MAENIIAARELQADHDSQLGSDDVMRRREAEARQEVAARASAVRRIRRRAVTRDRWNAMSQNWRPDCDQDYGQSRGH